MIPDTLCKCVKIVVDIRCNCHMMILEGFQLRSRWLKGCVESNVHRRFFMVGVKTQRRLLIDQACSDNWNEIDQAHSKTGLKLIGQT